MKILDETTATEEKKGGKLLEIFGKLLQNCKGNVEIILPLHF